MPRSGKSRVYDLRGWMQVARRVSAPPDERCGLRNCGANARSATTRQAIPHFLEGPPRMTSARPDARSALRNEAAASQDGSAASQHLVASSPTVPLKAITALVKTRHRRKRSAPDRAERGQTTAQHRTPYLQPRGSSARSRMWRADRGPRRSFEDGGSRPSSARSRRGTAAGDSRASRWRPCRPRRPASRISIPSDARPMLRRGKWRAGAPVRSASRAPSR